MKNKYPITMSFWIDKQQTHSVEVKSWSCAGMREGEIQWHWNVYAYIYETHPWFDKPEVLQTNLPLHYGASCSDLTITKPALGFKYDWQKEHHTFKFGSDYNHYTDPENQQSPLEGIPYYVERDALELVEWLKDRAEVTRDV